MKRACKLAAIAVFMTVPASAMAAMITQTFSSTALAPLYGSLGAEWTTPDGFITITSTGGDIFLGADRLGVAKAGETSAHNKHLNIGESLMFTFAAPVTDVTFGRNGGTFPIKLTSYGMNDALVFTTSAAFPYSLPTATLANGPDNKPILSFLLEGVVGTGAGLTQITYTKADIAPVPLPASGLLLLGGLAALAGFRRRMSQI